MKKLQSLREYELFVYTLQEKYPQIRTSTLIVVRDGPAVATLSGELFFDKGYRIFIWEMVTFDDGHFLIEDYGYEFWRNDEKLAWYDSQPHPNDPALAATHPHHKHIPPDIKHNRIPAPNMRFDQPNLPAMIEEILGLIA